MNNCPYLDTLKNKLQYAKEYHPAKVPYYEGLINEWLAHTPIEQAKLIEYAYPTSTTATKAGMSKTGCWFVALYKSITSADRVKVLKYFLNKSQAVEYANKLPNPYNWMHKYFN